MEVKDNRYKDAALSAMKISLCCIRVRELALVTVSVPFLALFFCFITAYIFRYDEVHETHCKVLNVIPSISAITGITPQTYLWRISVALHIGSRMLVARLYKNYLNYLADLVVDPSSWFKRLSISSCYWLNLMELSALCGVTYISNRENYPVHEKLFIIFMVCSLTYMCAVTWSFKIVHPVMTNVQNISYQVKKALFITSIISTITLIWFFFKHRWYCHDLAFTWFALSEYIIASCNMGFHSTVAMDFPQEQLVVDSTSTTTTLKKIK